MTLIEFLFLSKCLLVKSRRLLVDVSQTSSYQSYPIGSYDPENTFGMAPSSPTVQVQRFNSALNLYTNSTYGSSTALNTSVSTNVTSGVNGGSMAPGSTNQIPSSSKSALLTINSLLESNTVWQKEMEKGYDNLLEAILPLLGDVANTAKLQRWRKGIFYIKGAITFQYISWISSICFSKLFLSSIDIPELVRVL